MSKNKKYLAPKYPRIMVTPERHKKLANEARIANISIANLVESKFRSLK